MSNCDGDFTVMCACFIFFWFLMVGSYVYLDVNETNARVELLKGAKCKDLEFITSAIYAGRKAGGGN